MEPTALQDLFDWMLHIEIIFFTFTIPLFIAILQRFSKTEWEGITFLNYLYSKSKIIILVIVFFIFIFSPFIVKVEFFNFIVINIFFVFLWILCVLYFIYHYKNLIKSFLLKKDEYLKYFLYFLKSTSDLDDWFNLIKYIFKEYEYRNYKNYYNDLWQEINQQIVEDLKKGEFEKGKRLMDLILSKLKDYTNQIKSLDQYSNDYHQIVNKSSVIDYFGDPVKFGNYIEWLNSVSNQEKEWRYQQFIINFIQFYIFYCDKYDPNSFHLVRKYLKRINNLLSQKKLQKSLKHIIYQTIIFSEKIKQRSFTHHIYWPSDWRFGVQNVKKNKKLLKEFIWSEFIEWFKNKIRRNQNDDIKELENIFFNIFEMLFETGEVDIFMVYAFLNMKENPRAYFKKAGEIYISSIDSFDNNEKFTLDILYKLGYFDNWDINRLTEDIKKRRFTYKKEYLEYIKKLEKFLQNK